MQIPKKLQALLNPDEKIEFIEQPKKAAYNRRLYLAIGFSVVWLLGIDGFFYTNGTLFRNDFFPSLFGILFLNIPLFMAIFNAVRVQQRYPRSFYAYSNMRIIYTTMASVKEIDFVYFKDIHELQATKNQVILDMNDYQEYRKRKVYIMGVKNPSQLVSEVNKKLQAFRDPNL